MTLGGVVAIGNFDGVHLGHRAVLEQARARANGPVTVVTFWPHPLSVVSPERAPSLLCDLRTRIELLKEAGACQVRVVNFDAGVARWSPETFVHRILDPLNPQCVVVGDNFRFGHRASGDVTTLRELAAGRFEVCDLDLLQVGGCVTSSTAIRESLEAGDVAQATQHLGRHFRIRGVVVLGDQRGRQLGFPTANLIVAPELAVPADAVYAGYLTRLDIPERITLPAAISVGTNPTFNGHQRRVETHVLDRDDLELYGVEIAVDFAGKLRDQVRYSSQDALIDQMHLDIPHTKQILGITT